MDKKQQANGLLELIRVQRAEIEEIEEQANREIEAVREKYQERLDDLTFKLKAADKDLLALMRKNKVMLFEGEDKVLLEAGILLYGKEDKVSIPRNALAKLEELGYNEAIKTVKTVDRAVVEGWPDERLFVIGARRKPVETFSYELKHGKTERR